MGTRFLVFGASQHRQFSDAKRSRESRKKNFSKSYFFVHVASILVILAASGAAQERPKSGLRRSQELGKAGDGWGPGALWRSWALLGTFLLFFAMLFEFWSIFRRFLLRKSFGSWVFLLVLLAACCRSAGVWVQNKFLYLLAFVCLCQRLHDPEWNWFWT